MMYLAISGLEMSGNVAAVLFGFALWLVGIDGIEDKDNRLFYTIGIVSTVLSVVLF